MSFNDWREVKVDEIGKIITGKTPRTKNKEYYDGNIPFLTPSDNMDVKQVRNTLRTLTDIGVKSVRKCLLPEKSICVSCIGSQLGKVVMTTEPTVTNQQINSIIPNCDFDPDFVYYSMLILGEKLNYLSKTSTAVPIVNKRSFSSFTIQSPSFQEQKAIAHILSTLDEKIEVNNRINKTLEEMAQAIFKHWFVDFEFPNEEGEPYKSSGGEMVESELGMIPKGWEVGSINDIAVNKRDSVGSVDINKNENYVGLEHVPRRQLFLENWGNSSDITSNKYRFKKRDILFGKLRPYFHKVVFAPIDGLCSTDILVIIPKDELYYSYLLISLFSEEVINYANVVSTGTRMPRVNWNNISKFEIVVPDEEVLTRYSTVVKPIINKLMESIQENRNLTSIRDTILPKLMSGEIRVPLDNEE